MLSLQIEAKERVVLFGPSGCGKSTVLHLIAGLVIPDSGDILINDELVATAKKNLREPEQRGVGMVFQDLALWPHMTVGENIEFGLMAKRIPENKRRQRVMEMVDLVGLGDYLNARPGELSGGQQQRVALARTLAVAPSHRAHGRAAVDARRDLNMQLRRRFCDCITIWGSPSSTSFTIARKQRRLARKSYFSGRVEWTSLTPSPTARRAQAGSGVRARSARKDAREDRPRPCVA